jgi:hypothetical protein
VFLDRQEYEIALDPRRLRRIHVEPAAPWAVEPTGLRQEGRLQ